MAYPHITESDQWAQAWLSYELIMRVRNFSPKTISSRRVTISCLARTMTAAGVEPPGVTSLIMKKYMLSETERRRHSGVVTVYSDLKCFWAAWAAETGSVSPMDGVPRPRAAEAAPVPVLTHEQLLAVLRATEGRAWLQVRNRAVVLLLMETGIRRSELLALEPEDVRLRERELVIKRGKGGKPRVVVFGDDSALALQRWLKVRGNGPGTLLRGRMRGDLTGSGLTQLLYRVGRRAGIEGLRPHMFRHSWCHYNLVAGVGEHNIMQLAGWTTGKQLERYGAALAQQRALEAGKRISVARIVKLPGGDYAF